MSDKGAVKVLLLRERYMTKSFPLRKRSPEDKEAEGKLCEAYMKLVLELHQFGLAGAPAEHCLAQATDSPEWSVRCRWFLKEVDQGIEPVVKEDKLVFRFRTSYGGCTRVSLPKICGCERKAGRVESPNPY
ncbi:hypothetical protein PROFUN_11027 [Planoprotostelium fungivorum]|uniref:Uncharacterized protein n=1 Tax=Planoprotostelium fungivorum TaxID=1890364 RepID=A0A2P6NBS3_9EUKA|nr:hypothetical protein PROFUN_11027 [Planoprotostelium fungivorum]